MSDHIEYVLLPEKRIEEALVVQQNSMLRENIALGVGMFDDPNSAEQMKPVFREVVKDCCTMIALDTRTDQIVAVCFNKIHVQPQTGEPDPLQEFVENNIPDEACRGLVNFLADVESRVDLFKYYNARCLLELFFIGTDPGYGGLGIGQNLMKASIELGRRLGGAKTVDGGALAPEVAFGIFASNVSQRMASKFNFEWLATVFYDEYLYKGKKMSERIGDIHNTVKIGALRLV